MNNHFVNVLLPLPFDRAFTYKLSKENNNSIAIGNLVKVSFRKKELWGLVVEIDVKVDELVSLEKIKEVLEKNSQIKFDNKLIEFIERIASYNIAAKGLVLKSFIGILNSDKIKKPNFKAKIQEIDLSKFDLRKLSEKQQKITDKICEEVDKNKHYVSLLDGVTGSGKTEIYFAVIAKMLQKQENQILILLPEIALTSQLLSRFEKQFGFKPALWHSKITTKEKREIFYGLISGSLKVLIGARSALLLPFKNLKLIVIDEEHDNSFKQEEIFNFQARNMAILKAKLESFSVILSSATPSLETYVNAISGKYHHFILDEKFNQKINQVQIIDLCREKLPSDIFIAHDLKKAIVENFKNKQQSLLFLNRRGYAPVTLCKNCGQKVNCNNCSSYLVAHKKINKLLCHYCGENEKIHENCKFCGAENSLINIGVGVEKIKEEVEKLLPEAKIAIVTSDLVTSFNEAEELVNKITNHEIDIIIGTQLIAKGYDFPELTLVGIVDADSGFYSSELRSMERSYQLLSQVIGRAGRRDIQGQIFIQTYNPQNFIFEKIIKQDKLGFYEFEISNRQNANVMPFSKMSAFIISSFEEKSAVNFAKKLAAAFPFNDKIEIFGPAPMPIPRLKNRYYFRVFLKVEKKINLQKLITDVMQSLEIPSNVRIKVDVDL